jgi:acyl-homoserine-lactone acylase
MLMNTIESMKKAQLTFGNLRSRFLLFLACLFLCIPVFGFSPEELARWERQARDVSIVRDDWGIAHITGKTDADAIFGMIYAQAEDDFNRVETNYLNAMGRLAEAEGEAAIWRDLRMKIFIEPEDLKRKFAESPVWLQKLMTAWADGLNFYLAKNAQVKPRVITRFEPWMALSFTEGSIGGHIETISLARLQAFYGAGPVAERGEFNPLTEPSGSNGIAIAPKNTVGKNALLLINPHTSFFFRSELQVTSGEGLNAYGAVTWGQIFIYQGFNERLGWMHTSSSVDAVDEWRETVFKKGDRYFYKFGSEERPVMTSVIAVPYKTANGTGVREFTVYRTHHGPVVRKDESGNWVTVALMNDPVKALTQSFIRTKARNYKEFRQTFELHTNSSNNTIYADADGNIAYFHANFIPRRNPKFDWTKPVDGSDPESDWKGVLSFDESPNLLNPATGWLYNTNNYPWSAAGPASLKQTDFPKYVDNGLENARGIHAIKVLENRRDFTLDKLRDAAYDSYLPWFEKTVPALVAAWDKLPAADPLKAKLAEPVGVLRAWDYRWSIDSVATSLAVFWAMDILRTVGSASGVQSQDHVAASATPAQMVEALGRAADRLTADFGRWRTPWGEINRFQRLTGDIVQPFNDAGPSIPVGFTSGNWGSLASFGAGPTRNTKKWYGTSGNSFVAVVEFGKTVRAKAVTAGGESGDSKSPHFNDQALRYSTGNLREVYFYPAQLKNHTKRKYAPGN